MFMVTQFSNRDSLETSWLLLVEVREIVMKAYSL